MTDGKSVIFAYQTSERYYFDVAGACTSPVGGGGPLALVPTVVGARIFANFKLEPPQSRLRRREPAGSTAPPIGELQGDRGIVSGNRGLAFPFWKVNGVPFCRALGFRATGNEDGTADALFFCDGGMFLLILSSYCDKINNKTFLYNFIYKGKVFR